MACDTYIERYKVEKYCILTIIDYLFVFIGAILLLWDLTNQTSPQCDIYRSQSIAECIGW